MVNGKGNVRTQDPENFDEEVVAWTRMIELDAAVVQVSFMFIPLFLSTAAGNNFAIICYLLLLMVLW